MTTTVIVPDNRGKTFKRYKVGNEGYVVDDAVIAVVIDSPAAEDNIDLVVPFDCEITAVTLLADAEGSIVIDVWKDTYANYPPTDADSITASAPPTISSAVKSKDETLTGWTKNLSMGDILRLNVDSVDTIARITLVLTVEKV